jgi:uncharacterized MAPEG superfamily protein
MAESLTVLATKPHWGKRMNSEFLLLALCALLCLLLVLPYATALTLKLGLPVMAGNREGLPEPTGWIGRAKRAHMNMLENLVPFAVLLLAAHGMGKLGGLTLLGAQLFFWSRIAHAATQIAGIPYARTAAYLIGYVGMVLIFINIIR